MDPTYTPKPVGDWTFAISPDAREQYLKEVIGGAGRVYVLCMPDVIGVDRPQTKDLWEEVEVWALSSKRPGGPNW